MREQEGKAALSLAEAVNQGFIEYIPFPEALVGKYQAYTQADLTELRKAGCEVKFKSVQASIQQRGKSRVSGPGRRY